MLRNWPHSTRSLFQAGMVPVLLMDSSDQSFMLQVPVGSIDLASPIHQGNACRSLSHRSGNGSSYVLAHIDLCASLHCMLHDGKYCQIRSGVHTGILGRDLVP